MCYGLHRPNSKIKFKLHLIPSIMFAQYLIVQPPKSTSYQSMLSATFLILPSSCLI